MRSADAAAKHSDRFGEKHRPPRGLMPGGAEFVVGDSVVPARGTSSYRATTARVADVSPPSMRRTM